MSAKRTSLAPLERSRSYYEEEYEKKQRSLHDLAAEWHTYPNKILRELRRYGFAIRKKGEAQAIALKSGRRFHPTQGRERSPEEKLKISEGMYENWSHISEEERERRVETARKNWEKLSDEQKELFQKRASDAIHETAKSGSKLEKFLAKALTDEGYAVSYHSKVILPDSQLEVDLYIPSLRVVIEIDGPSHFLPIWGDDRLKKSVDADKKKNDQLNLYGFILIRVKHINQFASDAYKRKLMGEIMSILEEIKKKPLGKTGQLINIEIT
jgi:very-short-patch-repair endonuclease